MASTFVPSFERVPLTRNVGRPRKDGKRRTPPPPNSWPVYSLGKHASAALQVSRGRWTWKRLATDSGVPLTVMREDWSLFPATRDLSVPPDIPLEVAIASATRYIHETPDIYEPDCVAGLTAMELTAVAAEQPTRMGPGDIPGRTVVVISQPDSRLAKTLLCFATGPVGEDLNISPFLPPSFSRSHGKQPAVFFPETDPVEKFSTTILQISSSPVISRKNIHNRATSLAVRLASCTSMLHVLPNPSFVPPTTDHPVTTNRIGVLWVADTEGRRHVDVQLDPRTWCRAAVVDEGGGVWLWWEEKQRVDGKQYSTMKLLKVRDVVDEPHDGFFRIAFGTRQDTLLVLSRDSLTIIDFAALPHIPPPTLMLKSSEPDDWFLAMDATAAERNASLTCIVSTRQMLWIDENAADTPVLGCSYEGGNKSLHDLEVCIVPGSHLEDTEPDDNRSEVVLLSSPTLESIGAVQLSHDFGVTIQAIPWSPGGLPQALRSLIPLPFHTLREYMGFVSVVGVAADGSITLVKLSTDSRTTTQESKEFAWPQAKWSGPIQQLADQRLGRRAINDGHWSLKAQAKCNVFGARWVWSYINKLDTPDSHWHAPSFQQDLRESDCSFEHIMTAAERARDFVHGPLTSEHRSNLLRRLDFPMSVEEREQLRSLPTFFASHFPFVGRMAPAVPLLKQPSLLETTSNELGAAQQRTALETTRLELDISLSASIIWSEAIEVSMRAPAQLDDDDLFAAAARQLSLEEPSITEEPFRLLPPKPTHEGVPTDFSAAQPLLSEWVVGSDVTKYQWTEPQHMSDNRSPSRDGHFRRPLPPPPLPNTQPLPSLESFHSVPAVLPVPAVLSVPVMPFVAPIAPSAIKRSPVKPSAAAWKSSPPILDDGSQGPQFPQTQAEPGRFGARPEALRIGRKKVKKRRGGF